MRDTVDSLGRVRIQGILLLVIVFVAGAVAGAMLDRANPLRDRKSRGQWFERRSGGALGFPGLFDKLDLTDDQRIRIHSIFEAHRPVIDSLMSVTMPQIRAERDSAEAQISAILTPEQRLKFEKLSPRHRFPMGDWRRPFDTSEGGGMRRRGPGPR